MSRDLLAQRCRIELGEMREKLLSFHREISPQKRGQHLQISISRRVLRPVGRDQRQLLAKKLVVFLSCLKQLGRHTSCQQRVDDLLVNTMKRIEQCTNACDQSLAVRKIARLVRTQVELIQQLTNFFVVTSQQFQGRGADSCSRLRNVPLILLRCNVKHRTLHE